jgi:hypothetical protein
MRSHNLATSGTLTLSGVTNVEFGLQSAGDADNNNVVNAQDFTVVRATFGQPAELRLEFNNDDMANATDFSPLRPIFAVGEPRQIAPSRILDFG